MTLIKLFCEFFLGHVNFCSGWYNSLIHLPEGQVLKKNFGKDCALYIYKSSSAFTIPKINTKWTKIIYLYLMRADLEA